MQLYALAFTFAPNETSKDFTVQVRWFRPIKIYTNVTEEGIGVIHGIYFPKTTEDNFILGEPDLDLYDFSLYRIIKLRDEFLQEHGLTGKSDDFIQNYLDDNDLSLPDVMRWDLPTVSQGQTIRITGNFPKGASLSMMGYTP